MSDTEKLAEKAISETPWWATAPIWLAAGIVGVPSLIAIGAGYFIASNVVKNQEALKQFNQTEIQQLTEIRGQNEGILRFVEADLRVQYRTCIAASTTNEAREACISAAEREKELGLNPNKDGQ